MSVLYRLGLTLLFVAVFAAPVAVGDLTNTVIVSNLDNPYRTDFQAYVDAGQVFENIYTFDAGDDDALEKARELAAGGTHVTILVIENVTAIGQPVPNPYVTNIELLASDDISIEGYPNASPQHPERVIIQASDSGMPVLDLNGASANVTIEGVTLTGGTYGVHARAGAAATVQRCYIRDNSSHGVFVDDDANAFFVNCSIVNNGGDGVRVEKLLGAGVKATLQFCTVKDNTGDGVHIAGTADLTAYNTLITDNGGFGMQQAAGGTGTITLSHNHAVHNTAGDWSIPSPPATDPDLVSFAGPYYSDDPWIGKLEISGAPNDAPLAGQGDGSLLPTAAVDFENNARPANPTIGADEFADSGLLEWTQCYVIGPSPIGRLEEGQLTVEVWFTGPLSAEGDIYIVPQGVDENDRDNTIPITIQAGSGSGVYRGTNARAITTNLTDPDAVPTAGDTIADGHATVWLWQSNAPYGDATEQAVQGRNLLIDTIPPRVTLDAGYVYAADNLVALTANPAPEVGALGVTFGSARHPYPALPAWAQQANAGRLTTTGGTVWPLTEVAGAEPQVFFNVGSVANVYGAMPLVPVVTVRLQDPDVFALYGVGSGRPVAGFVDGSFTGDTGANVLASGTSGGVDLPALWSGDSAALASVGVNFAVGSPAIASTTDPVTNTDYPSEADMTWTFPYDPDLEPPGGIPVPAGDMHVVAQFVGRDRAGNQTSLDADMLEPAFHLWWLRGTGMTTPVMEMDVPGLFPRITWGISPSIDTGINTSAANALQPLYTYRLWRSQSAGIGNQAGPYDPITNWTSWDYTTVLNPDYFDSLEYTLNNATPSTTLADHWLLVTVGSVDEAGNVQPWPSGFDPTVSVSGESGDNWRAFYIPGTTTLLDTTLTANMTIRNPDSNLGAVTVLPRILLPAEPATPLGDTMYAGVFDVAAVKSNADEHFVDFSVSVDGIDVNWEPSNVTVLTAVDPSRVILNIESWLATEDTYNMRLTINAFSADFTDMNIRRQTNFIFRATARNDVTSQIDATPATFAFTIVPGTVAQYLESSRGEQPVKSHETE